MIYKTLLLIILTVFLMASPALAEQTLEEVIQDTEVTAESLNIKDPEILPDSPFYFLKEWGRNIRSFLTFNNVEKLELKNRFANENLLELKKLVEKNSKEEVLQKTIRRYQERMGDLEKATEGIKSQEAVDRFLDKYTNQQILHQRILEKLENQVPEKTFQKIEEARQEHLERFKNVMLKLEDKEKIAERIADSVKEQTGSQFQEFKNLEIIERIRKNMPGEIEEKLQEKEREILESLKNNLESATQQEQERFQQYMKEQLRIMDQIESRIQEGSRLRKRLQEAKEKIPF